MTIPSIKETGMQLIDDLSGNLVSFYIDKLKQSVGDGRAVAIQKWRGAQCYQTSINSQDGYYFLMDEGEITYLVHYEAFKYNSKILGRRVMLWRHKNEYSSGGFAAEVFFNILLPKFGALVADEEQTENGKGFWTWAMGVALKKGLHVYMVDRRIKPDRIQPLLNDADIKKHQQELWGRGEQYKKVHAMISRKPL